MTLSLCLAIENVSGKIKILLLLKLYFILFEMNLIEMYVEI